MAKIKNPKYREPDDFFPASVQKEFGLGKYAKKTAKKTTKKTAAKKK